MSPIPSWTIESVAPLDAFGAAGSSNRAAVAQLYGGRRPTVARGWTTENGRFLSITLVSPYPNRELTALEPGTLIIRVLRHRVRDNLDARRMQSNGRWPVFAVFLVVLVAAGSLPAQAQCSRPSR